MNILIYSSSLFRGDIVSFLRLLLYTRHHSANQYKLMIINKIKRSVCTNLCLPCIRHFSLYIWLSQKYLQISVLIQKIYISLSSQLVSYQRTPCSLLCGDYGFPAKLIYFIFVVSYDISLIV